MQPRAWAHLLLLEHQAHLLHSPFPAVGFLQSSSVEAPVGGTHVHMQPGEACVHLGQCQVWTCCLARQGKLPSGRTGVGAVMFDGGVPGADDPSLCTLTYHARLQTSYVKKSWFSKQA